MRSPGIKDVLLAGGLIAALGACSGDEPQTSPASSPPASPSPTAEPSETPKESPRPKNSPGPPPGPAGYVFVYIDGSTLSLLELDDGRQSRVGEVPSPDFYADPAGGPMAFIAGAGAGDDFAGQPVLNLFDPESRSGDPIGPGFAPVWGPDGVVAYLEPVGPRDCSGETCDGDRRVVTFDTFTGKRERLLGPGRWGILAWAGSSHLIVSDEADLSHALVVSTSDESTRTLPFPPSEIWDASPDGKWLVRAFKGGAEFVPLAEGRPSGPRREISVGGAVLAAGSWAPDSSGVTAVLLQTGGGSSKLVSISPADPVSQAVPGSMGAGGPVLYSPDSESFLFTRELPSGRLAAVHCLVAGAGCDQVLSWRDEVIPLRVELAP